MSAHKESFKDWLSAFSSRVSQIEEEDKQKEIKRKQEEEQEEKQKKRKNMESLDGLRVLHDVSQLPVNKTIILTLKDGSIYDDGPDQLENTQLVDDEKAQHRKMIQRRINRNAQGAFAAYEEENEEGDNDYQNSMGGLSNGSDEQISRSLLRKYNTEDEDFEVYRRKQGFIISTKKATKDNNNNNNNPDNTESTDKTNSSSLLPLNTPTSTQNSASPTEPTKIPENNAEYEEESGDE